MERDARRTRRGVSGLHGRVREGPPGWRWPARQGDRGAGRGDAIAARVASELGNGRRVVRQVPPVARHDPRARDPVRGDGSAVAGSADRRDPDWTEPTRGRRGGNLALSGLAAVMIGLTALYEILLLSDANATLLIGGPHRSVFPSPSSPHPWRPCRRRARRAHGCADRPGTAVSGWDQAVPGAPGPWRSER